MKYERLHCSLRDNYQFDWKGDTQKKAAKKSKQISVKDCKKKTENKEERTTEWQQQQHLNKRIW